MGKPKKERYDDVGTVGRSNLVPYVEGEDPKARHARRWDHALSNQENVANWCTDNNVTFTVKNYGHHWKFQRDDLVVEWWPSSAKFVWNRQYDKGLHVHDFQQLLKLLERHF